MKNSEKRSLIAFSAATAVCLTGDSFLYVALPLYFKEVGLTALWQVGLLLAINRLIRIPLNPWISRLYHRLPIKLGMLLAIGLAAIVTTGYAFAETFLFWCILRLIWGISWSFLRIGGLLALVDLNGSHDHGKWVGMYNGIVRIGSFFGMAGGGVLVWIIGFRETSFIFAVVISISFIVMWFTKLPVRPPDNMIDVKTSSISIRNDLGFYVLAGFLIALLSQGIFTSSFSYIMAYHYGNQLSLFGTIVDLAAIAGTIQAVRWLWEPFVAVAAGKSADKSGPIARGILPITILTAIMGILLLISAPLVLWVLFAVLYMMGFSWLTTLMDVRAASVNKAVAHSFIGIYTMWSDIGAAIGPIIVYLAFSFNGGMIAVFILSAIILVGLGVKWKVHEQSVSPLP